MKKIDYKSDKINGYKATHGKVSELVIPDFQMLCATGSGDPNGSERFKAVTQALFTASYKIKFLVKNGDIGIDYGVMPLQGLWWSRSQNTIDHNDKSDWDWRLMIMQPEFVSKELLEEGIKKAAPSCDESVLSELELVTHSDGLVMQTLHLGPYADEQATIDLLHSAIDESPYTACGLHHEIYLNNPDRTAPEKLKTIIRQPVVNS